MPFFCIIWLILQSKHFSMPLWIVIFLSKFDYLLILYGTLHFQCYETSLRVLLIWIFSWHHFLWDIFILFVTTTLLLFSDNFIFTKFLWLQIQSLSNGSSSSIPIPNYFIYNSIYLSFKFHLQHYNFLFLCCTFIFPRYPFFWLSIFVKCHVDNMSVGDETMQLHIFLSLCEQNNRHTGTNQWQFEWRDVIGHFIMILIGYLYGDLYGDMEDYSWSLYFLQLQLILFASWNLNHIIWYYITKLW